MYIGGPAKLVQRELCVLRGRTSTLYPAFLLLDEVSETVAQLSVVLPEVES